MDAFLAGLLRPFVLLTLMLVARAVVLGCRRVAAGCADKPASGDRARPLPPQRPNLRLARDELPQRFRVLK